jgi:hypothetical protein
MRRVWVVITTFVVLAAGCSCSSSPAMPDTGARLDARAGTDAPTVDATAASDAPMLADTATPADAPLAMDVPETPDAPPAIDAPVSVDAPVAVADAGADAPRADAPTPITVTILDPYAYGNCFGGPPDPVFAGWDVRITGASGATAMLTSAVLRVEGAGTPFTQSLTIDDPLVTLTGGTGMASMRKVSGNPSNPPGCSSCGMGSAAFTFDLVFVVDGMTIPVSASGSYDCVV